MTSPVFEAPKQYPAIRIPPVQTKPGRSPELISVAQDAGVMPSIRSRCSETAFSPVRPRIRTHSGASVGKAGLYSRCMRFVNCIPRGLTFELSE